MKRFFLSLLTVGVLTLPAFSFSAGSIYGIYTDTPALKQRPEPRDMCYAVEQYVSDVTSDILKTDESVQKTIFSILMKISPNSSFNTLKSKTDLIKCNNSISDVEQNSQIFAILADYTLKLKQSGYKSGTNNLLSDDIANLNKELEKYTRLKNNEYNTDDILSSIKNINKQNKLKSEITELASIINTRISELSNIIELLSSL